MPTFGQPSQPAASNPFGQPSVPAGSFGAFGASTNTNGPSTGFGAPLGGTASSPFQQASQAAQQSAAPALGQPSGASPYPPGSSRQHPPVESYTSRNMDGTLCEFKGKPVAYAPAQDGKTHPAVRNFDGSMSRIWFPDGPPGYNKDTELPDDKYDAREKGLWQAFVQTGKFAGGVMPELPPKREFCTWEF